MTAKMKDEALRKPAPATPFSTRKRTYLKSGARVRIWKFITAMFVALACAALLYWHDLTAGPIFAAGMLFFASLTALAGWSASVSIQFERQCTHKTATHALAWSIALALLAVMLLCGAWIAAVIYALLLTPVALVLLPGAENLEYEDLGFGDGGAGWGTAGSIYDSSGMLLGAGDVSRAGDARYHHQDPSDDWL